jgi:hypothetical protein
VGRSAKSLLSESSNVRRKNTIVMISIVPQNLVEYEDNSWKNKRYYVHVTGCPVVSVNEILQVS